jgi:TolA-binding protein
MAAFDAFCQRFPASPQVAQAKLKKAYWLVKKGDVQAAEAQFERVAAEHAGQAEAGEATLRLGYLLLRQEKEAQALSCFYSVAAAKVKASEEVRVEAILRTAALYHRGHDLDAAMQAYDVIAQGATSAEARAFAEMQQAGLWLEKAWNQKASFGQARAKCDQVLERYPQANKAIRATAAVMALETLAYERDFPGMLKREKAFLDEFAQTEESTLAFYWLAKARLETGDAQGAAGILESLMAARFDTAKRFKYVEVNSQARRLAARAYEKLGDKAKAQALLEAR